MQINTEPSVPPPVGLKHSHTSDLWLLKRKWDQTESFGGKNTNTHVNPRYTRQVSPGL